MSYLDLVPLKSLFVFSVSALSTRSHTDFIPHPPPPFLLLSSSSHRLLNYFISRDDPENFLPDPPISLPFRRSFAPILTRSPPTSLTSPLCLLIRRTSRLLPMPGIFSFLLRAVGTLYSSSTFFCLKGSTNSWQTVTLTLTWSKLHGVPAYLPLFSLLTHTDSKPLFFHSLIHAQHKHAPLSRWMFLMASRWCCIAARLPHRDSHTSLKAPY